MKASSSESDLGDYLSNLRKKTVGNKSDIHIEGLSDFSLSDLSEKKEHHVGKKSKFLKPKPIKQLEKDMSISKKENPKKKKKEKSTKKSKNKENRTKKPKVPQIKDEFTDSEINFSLSSSLNEKKHFNESSNYVPKLNLNSSKHKTNKGLNLSERSDDIDETSFGKDGNRFLKPKQVGPVKPPDPTPEANLNIVSEELSSSREFSSPRKSTLRSSRSSSHKKKVTILENKQIDSLSSLDYDPQNSNDDFVKSKSDSGSENDNNFCGLNIMSINDLVEDNLDEPTIEESIPNHGHFSVFEKIMSLEELENNFNNVIKESPQSSELRDSRESNDSLSEIKTVPSATPRKSFNLSRNISISEDISVSQQEQSAISSSGSKIHSVEFEDSRKEKHETNVSISSKKSRKSLTYSSDFTEEDATLRLNSKKASIKEIKSKSSKPVHVFQDDRKSINNLHINPMAGMESVEPVPIAQYIVSPEALESLTAYSPSMLLMTNMLRQQIQMTTNFIETQRRLYDSLISSITPTYQYSSLQEAKEFIKSNKTKPLTMKEALRMIENEE